MARRPGGSNRITVLVYGRVIDSNIPTRIRAYAEVQQAYLGTPRAVAHASNHA